jgi:hypothetical protein
MVIIQEAKQNNKKMQVQTPKVNIYGILIQQTTLHPAWRCTLVAATTHPPAIMAPSAAAKLPMDSINSRRLTSYLQHHQPCRRTFAIEDSTRRKVS